MDLYAAALVIYISVSGHAPYDHLGIDTRNLKALLEVKGQEGVGRESPIQRAALRRLGALGARLFELLDSCVGKHRDQRPSCREARQRLLELQRLQKRAPSPGR
jgi:hypothetical protein